MSPKPGDYARAQASGVRCVPLLVETFGGLSPPLVDALRTAAEWRKNKLTTSEYDETTSAGHVRCFPPVLILFRCPCFNMLGVFVETTGSLS